MNRQNQTAKLSDMFLSVLDYALPDAKWRYHGKDIDNRIVAEKFLPLFLHQTRKWLDSFSDSREWGFGELISIEKSRIGPTLVISGEACLAPLLLFALEVAMYAHNLSVETRTEFIALDFLDY